MAAENITFPSLKTQITKGTPAPVYLLHGEEGFFIDQIIKLAEEIIPEADRDFDLTTIYAPQVTADVILDACHRYPMMSPRQVVIVHEVQAWKATEFKKLKDYFLAPSPSTILFLGYRGEAIKTVELPNAVRKGGGVVFESRKLTPTLLANAIAGYIKERGLTIDEKSLAMLTDFVGTDLSRIYNEVNKLTVTLGAGARITPEVIERNIGISKDYNNFEFVSAIANRDFVKSMKIVDYFARDPRNHPVQPITPLIFNLFSNLLIAFYAPDKSERGLMGALGFKWQGQLKDVSAGMRNYRAGHVVEILSALRDFDGMSKGNGSRMDAHDLFRDLVYRILTTGLPR